MSRRVDQIQHIFPAVLCLIDQPDRLGFDRNPALPLKLHIVQHLRLHLPLGQKPRHLNDPVRQCRLSVVNMRDNAKIADV